MSRWSRSRSSSISSISSSSSSNSSSSSSVGVVRQGRSSQVWPQVTWSARRPLLLFTTPGTTPANYPTPPPLPLSFQPIPISYLVPHTTTIFAPMPLVLECNQIPKRAPRGASERSPPLKTWTRGGDEKCSEGAIILS